MSTCRNKLYRRRPETDQDRMSVPVEYLCKCVDHYMASDDGLATRMCRCKMNPDVERSRKLTPVYQQFDDRVFHYAAWPGGCTAS